MSHRNRRRYTVNILTLEDLLQHTVLNPETGCRLWTRQLDDGGYGRTRFRGRSQKVHRVAWTLAFGEIPPNLLVCHTCDAFYPPSEFTNRRCSEPSHLRLGTHKNNTEDMWNRGRANPARGERSGMRLHPESICHGERQGSSKLTVTDIIDIRTSPEGDSACARRLGLHRVYVHRVRKRLTWKHVP